jgi:hypothetical protein
MKKENTLFSKVKNTRFSWLAPEMVMCFLFFVRLFKFGTLFELRNLGQTPSCQGIVDYD